MKPEDYKEFVCRYYHDGSWWSLNIMAKDVRDAEARVAKLGNLQLQGELMMTLQAFRGAGILTRAIVSLRNKFSPAAKSY